MAHKKTLITLGIAALALAASTVGAFAATAYATSNVNVRSGPGGGYDVVDNLRRGERVDIDRCRGSWCYVFSRDTEGWVSANYLGDRSRPSRDVDVDVFVDGGGYYGPRYHRPPPPFYGNGPRRPYYGGGGYGGGGYGGGGFGIYFGN
jgi:hypothetical protein